MMKLHERVSIKKTDQSQKIPGSNQQQNNAGGFSFVVDDWTRLDRFLILGSEKNFYSSAQELTVKNCEAVARCIKEDGQRVVARILEISDSGRAPKNDPALFALAMCSKLGDDETRKMAYAILPKVARIGTHLFHFAEYRKAFGGWGRGMKNAVAKWYLDKPVEKLTLQLVKYQQRDGWSHRDLLRLSHPMTKESDRAAAFEWVTYRQCSPEQLADKKYGGTIKKRANAHEDYYLHMPKTIIGFEDLQEATSAKQAVELIKKYKLPRECVPTELMKSPEVWEALLFSDMGLTAMIRNLGNMSKCGLLMPMSKATQEVVRRLGDKEELKKSRIHPVQILLAFKTYAQGHGMLGKGEWKVVQPVVDALDGTFYDSFSNVQPTGKNLLIGIDISGSMNTSILGNEVLSAREASCFMAMVTARVEKSYHIMAFTHKFEEFKCSPRARLDQVVAESNRLSERMAGTDCSLPIIWAQKNKVNFDAFQILTDSETWAGNIHPVQALQEYRRKTGIPAKLVVQAFSSNEFSIADPNDAGMMDVCGLDAAGPQLIADFIKG